MAAVTAVTAPYGLRFDAGRICLDLLATAHPGEHLGSLPALRAWITGAHLVPPGTSLTHADASWPPRFRELRYAIDRLVRTQLAAGTVDTRPCDLALARVNALARPAPPAPARCAAGTAPWCGCWTARPGARRCSRPWHGTRWTCSPTRSPGPRCASARATTARSSTWTPRGAGAGAGAPARCAATGSGSPVTAAAWPAPARAAEPPGHTCVPHITVAAHVSSLTCGWTAEESRATVSRYFLLSPGSRRTLRPSPGPSGPSTDPVEHPGPCVRTRP